MTGKIATREDVLRTFVEIGDKRIHQNAIKHRMRDDGYDYASVVGALSGLVSDGALAIAADGFIHSVGN